MTNKEWINFLVKEWNISRTSAKEMLHAMMSVKKEDNFKRQFNPIRTEERMDKELLMLYGAAYAVLRYINDNSTIYSKKLNNGKWISVAWVDIFDYLTDLIDNYKEGSDE